MTAVSTLDLLLRQYREATAVTNAMHAKPLSATPKDEWHRTFHRRRMLSLKIARFRATTIDEVMKKVGALMNIADLTAAHIEEMYLDEADEGDYDYLIPSIVRDLMLVVEAARVAPQDSNPGVAEKPS